MQCRFLTRRLLGRWPLVGLVLTCPLPPLPRPEGTALLLDQLFLDRSTLRRSWKTCQWLTKLCSLESGKSPKTQHDFCLNSKKGVRTGSTTCLKIILFAINNFLVLYTIVTITVFCYVLGGGSYFRVWTGLRALPVPGLSVAQGANRGIVGLERGAGNWTKIGTLVLAYFHNYFCAWGAYRNC